MKEINQNDVSNYIKFMKLFRFNVNNEIPFVMSRMIEQCEVDRLTPTVMGWLGYIKIEGRGRGVKYDFKLARIEPIHARSVLEGFAAYDAAMTAKGRLKKKQELEKTAEATTQQSQEEVSTPAATSTTTEKPIIKGFEEVRKRIGLFTTKRVVTYIFN